MLRGLIFLVNGFGGIGDVLSQWEQIGVFTYIIPFLLIFALIFGILTQTGLFKEKKAINAIIALSVSLMALQFDFVSTFFAEVFPRLVILLVVMVLLGLFAPNRTWVTYTLFGAAAVILIVVLANTATAVQWFSSGFLAGVNWQGLLPWIILIVLVAVVIVSSRTPKREQDVSSNFMEALFGGKNKP